MKQKTRGYVEIAVGIILFFIPVGLALWLLSTFDTRYAPEFGYILLMPMIAGLFFGLFSGLLLLSGYNRAAGKGED